MVDQLGVLYTVGTLSFLAATVIALYNYRQTRRITSYWCIVAVAGVAGMLWTGSYLPDMAGFDINYPDYSHFLLATASFIGYVAASLVALTTDATMKLL